MSLINDVGQRLAAQLPASSPTPPPSASPAGRTPVGDGSFSTQVSGTKPQPQMDLQLAEMANDSYTLSDPTTHSTGMQSEKDLQAAGWTRLQPAPGEHPDHLVDANGNRVNIDPAALEDPSSGFRAAIYQNQQGQYVVAYAGTDPSQLPDIGADASQAFGLGAKQYNEATALAKQAEVAFGQGNVVFTGHSLGGGLASAAALATDATAVTFNSAGLSNQTLRDLGFNPNAAREDLADSGQVRRYVVDSDPLTLAQQGLPAIPVPGLGPISPPNAVGHELDVALPPGMTPILGAHGGSGDNTSYVEALRTQTARDPGNAGVISNTIQDLAELNFNSIGTAIGGIKNVVTDTIDTIKNTASNVADDARNEFGQGQVISGTTHIAGDLANGALDLAGKVGSDAISTGGKAVRNVTDTVGQILRDVGQATGLQKPLDFVAGIVEGGGNLVSKGADAIGKGFSWAADKIGDGLNWSLDKVGDGLQWTANKVVEGAKVVGDAVVDGAKVVGNAVVDGAKAVGNAVVDGAKAVGNAVADGAKAVGNAVSKAMPWNW